MIRLTIAPEPASFQKKVREPGENALAALAGKPLPHALPRHEISAYKMVGGQRVLKKIEDFPYWRECLPELHEAYRGICAYYCFRIEMAALPQVDHFVAKCEPTSDLAYEWSNYRLACGYANTCKNKYPDVLDPASIEDGWFLIDLDTLDVRANPAVPAALRAKIDATISRLKLNEERAREVRQRALDHFRGGRVSFEYLETENPFLAKELTRRGIRNSQQLPALPPRVTDTIEPEL